MPTDAAVSSLSEDSVLRALLSKESTWEGVRRLKSVDLVVLGGGFAAAAFSHGAAFNGLSVLVVTPEDLAATERNEVQGFSWFETADGNLAWPSQASRRYGGLLGLLHAAPHRVKAKPLSPSRNSTWTKRTLKRSYWTALKIILEGRSGEKAPDRVTLNPYLLTSELWLSAKNEGAKVLSHCRVIKSQGVSSRQFELTVQDLGSNEQLTLKAGAVVDFDSLTLRRGSRFLKSQSKKTRGSQVHWQNINGYFVPPIPDLLSDRLAALRGLAHILVLSDATRIVEVAPFAGRKLPGAGSTAEILLGLIERGIGELEATRLVERYGYQSRFFLENQRWLEKLPGGLFVGEVYFAALVEGIISFEGFAKSLGVDPDVTKRALEASGIQITEIAPSVGRTVATG